MSEYTPQGFGDRLQAAMERRGWSVKGDLTRLQEEAAKLSGGSRGTSYANIYSYVHGRGPIDEPRREVVKALATVLNVLPDHLVYGGPRTAEESPLYLPRDENREARQKLRIDVYAAVRNEIGALMPVGLDVGITELIMTTVAAVARGMALSGDEYGENEPARYLAAATQLGRAVSAPLSQLSIDPSTWPEAVKAQYLLQSMSSLLLPLDLKYDRAVSAWSAAREATAKRKARNSRKKR